MLKWIYLPQDGHYLLYGPCENLALKLDKLKELHETPTAPVEVDRKAISHDPRHSVDMSGHFNRVRLTGVNSVRVSSDSTSVEPLVESSPCRDPRGRWHRRGYPV